MLVSVFARSALMDCVQEVTAIFTGVVAIKIAQNSI